MRFEELTSPIRVSMTRRRLHSDTSEKERGNSLVTILIGLLISSVVIVGASKFFLDSAVRSKEALGDSELMVYTNLLVKRGFTDDCKLLNIFPPSTKFIDELPKDPKLNSVVVSTLDEKAIKNLNVSHKISFIKNEKGKNFYIKSIKLIQRGSVVGKNPPSVLVDLVFTVSSQTSKASRGIQDYEIEVPSIFKLDKNLTFKSCNAKPDPDEICEYRGGKFDFKTSTCT